MMIILWGENGIEQAGENQDKILFSHETVIHSHILEISSEPLGMCLKNDIGIA